MVADLGQMTHDAGTRRQDSSAAQIELSVLQFGYRGLDIRMRVDGPLRITTQPGCDGGEVALRDLDLADSDLSRLISIVEFRQRDEMFRGELLLPCLLALGEISRASSHCKLRVFLGVLGLEACDLRLDCIDARLRALHGIAQLFVVELDQYITGGDVSVLLDGDAPDGAVDFSSHGRSVGLDVGVVGAGIATAEEPEGAWQRRSALLARPREGAGARDDDAVRQRWSQWPWCDTAPECVPSSRCWARSCARVSRTVSSRRSRVSRSAFDRLRVARS